MVTDFIDSVVIIDDQEDEIRELQKVLQDEDISVTIQLVDPKDKQFKNITALKKYRQIIFMDLSLDDSIDIKNNVSTIIRPLLRKILPETKGCYGLVVWSKHTEDIDILKEKLQEDKEKYTLPMFIVPFDKNEYLKNNYEGILTDLNSALTNDKAAYFFVNWMNTVKQAANNAISDIYSLVPEYDKQQTELIYLMYKMALNHTGIPVEQVKVENYNLTTDAYKAFDELLYSDLINQQDKNPTNIFDSISEDTWGLQEETSKYAKLNTKLFIDDINIDQKVIIPGNVYEITGNDSNLKIENQPKASKCIGIELTPPCDFSHKKVNSKLVKGFMYDFSKKNR